MLNPCDALELETEYRHLRVSAPATPNQRLVTPLLVVLVCAFWALVIVTALAAL